MKKSNKKFFIATVLILVVATIYCGFQLTSAINRRTLEIHNKTLLDLQEKCAKQAREEFKSEGRSASTSSFVNHYSFSMNKCFMLIEETTTVSDTVWTNSYLSDAFEGKSYGTYNWHTMPNKKYWEVPPMTCEVNMPTGEIKSCKSSDEFDDLVKIYMDAK